MSAPPNDGYGQFPGHQQQQFEQPAPAGDPQQDAAAAPGKKKKRGYAAQAFDVGSGANAGVAGGGPQFGITPVPQLAQPYGSYPQPDSQQPAAPGFQYPQGYGASQPADQHQQPGPYGSYPGPEQGYPPPGGAPQPGPPGVSGITQGMGGMQLGGQQQQQQQPLGAQAPRAGPLNHLYPTDLVNQPFSVSELELPPPPIVLPPNVSLSRPCSLRRGREC